MVNVYILVSDKQRQLTIDGSLELFRQLLAAVQRVAPPERSAVESKETERRLARMHLEPAASAAASTARHSPAAEKRL